MFNKSFTELCLICLILTVICQCQKRPNILILIADDLGIGDVGLFGNTSLPTPNIDGIGKDGTTLTHHLTAASVCTPSRSAFLTGRLPIRTGMASPQRNRVFLFLASSGGLPQSETTFAKVLKGHNYSTALIGKWHLGLSCHRKDDLCHHPLKHGFDYFYGLPLTNLKDFGNDGDSVVLSYFPNLYRVLASVAVTGLSLVFWLNSRKCRKLMVLALILLVFVPGLLFAFQKSIKLINSVLMRNGEVIEQPIQLETLTERIVGEAKEFLRKQGPGSLCDRNPKITKKVKEVGCHSNPFLLQVNFHLVHTALMPSKRFRGRSRFGKYGDSVLELDWAVGEILEELSRLGLKNDTLVYFSSDNGGHVEEVGLDGRQEGGHNGIYRGSKGHGAKEGGIRVPTAISWPGVIRPGHVISAPTSQMDLFATFHEMLNISLPDGAVDGQSLLPLLMGQIGSSPHKFLFHYCGTYLHGVRYIEGANVWKLYYFTPRYIEGAERCEFVCQCFGQFVVKHEPPLLYNIALDPSEDRLIDSGSKKYKEVEEIIKEAVREHQAGIKPVPSQFSFLQSLWRPWMQPCRRFPFCTFTEK